MRVGKVDRTCQFGLGREIIMLGTAARAGAETESWGGKRAGASSDGQVSKTAKNKTE